MNGRSTGRSENHQPLRFIFGIVPISVNMDKRLSRNDLKVLIALASFQGKKKYSFPTRKAISERSGVHVSHISKHTQRLQKLGYIEIIQRGKQISNVYNLPYLSARSLKREKGGMPHAAPSPEATTAHSGYAGPAPSIIKEHSQDKSKEEGGNIWKAPVRPSVLFLMGSAYHDQIKERFPDVKRPGHEGDFQKLISLVCQINSETLARERREFLEQNDSRRAPIEAYTMDRFVGFLISRGLFMADTIESVRIAATAIQSRQVDKAANGGSPIGATI
jgi:hypothetical protein